MTSTAAQRPDYAVIVGQGRSGTNWLLELFDVSPETFCRNEPYGAPESPLNQLLEHRFIVRPETGLMEERWDAAAQWTARHMGHRDPQIRVQKDYLYEVARRLGLYRIVKGPRCRSVLSRVIPSLRGAEWPIPPWIGSSKRLAESLPVLKLVTSPGWAVFLLRHRPHIPVIHIVRHPGGFLNSWANRYRSSRSPEQVRRENIARLEAIVAADSRWGADFGEIRAMAPEESELWYWHYANETIFEAGQGSRRYHPVIYEELVADPVAIAERLYRACGLRFDPQIRSAIQATTSDSSQIAAAWRERLSAAQQRLAEAFADRAEGFYRSASGGLSPRGLDR